MVNQIKHLAKRGYIGVSRNYQMWRDSAALKKTILPSNFEDRFQKNKAFLQPYHHYYITEVSVDFMAVSLELATFLLTFCEIIQPSRVVDLGSGFSSFVLRHYIVNQSPETTIWSVDDDADWLQKTVAFLEKYDLPTHNVEVWDTFSQSQEGNFDLVLQDIGVSEMRKGTLQQVFGLARPGGYILLDDMHKPSYVSQVHVANKPYNHQLFSLRHYTKDKFARFASLAVARN